MAEYDAGWQSNILPAATVSGKAPVWVRRDPAYAMRSSTISPATKIGVMPELMRRSYPSQQAAPEVADGHNACGENSAQRVQEKDISAWGPAAGREGVRERHFTPADPSKIARYCIEEDATRRGQRCVYVDPSESAMADAAWVGRVIDPGRRTVNNNFTMEDRRMYNSSFGGQRSEADLIEQRSYYESVLWAAWLDVKSCTEQKNNAIYELDIVNQQLSRVLKENDMLKEMYGEQTLRFENALADAHQESKEALAQLKRENEKLKTCLDQLVESFGRQQAAKPTGICIGTLDKQGDEGPRNAIVKPSDGPFSQQSTVATTSSSSLCATAVALSGEAATGTLPTVSRSAVEIGDENGATEDVRVASDAVKAALEAQPQHRSQHQQQLQQQRRQQWRRSSQQQQHRVQRRQHQLWRKSQQQQHHHRVQKQQQNGIDRDILAIDWWLARVKVKWKSGDHRNSVRATGQVDRCTITDAVQQMPNSTA